MCYNVKVARQSLVVKCSTMSHILYTRALQTCLFTCWMTHTKASAMPDESTQAPLTPF